MADEPTRPADRHARLRALATYARAYWLSLVLIAYAVFWATSTPGLWPAPVAYAVALTFAAIAGTRRYDRLTVVYTVACGGCGWQYRTRDENQARPAMLHHIEFNCPVVHRQL